MNKEYEEMRKMTYFQLVEYLQGKYGIPNGSYWLTPSCKTKNNKIMRGNEGLYCHHVKENLHNCLCNKDRAKEVPFDWHKGNNLVYCNYLEHSLLHLKIAEWIDTEKPIEYSPTSGLGYFGDIARFTRDMLNGYKFSMPFYKIVTKQMKPFHQEIKQIFKDASQYKYGKNPPFNWFDLLDVEE